MKDVNVVRFEWEHCAHCGCKQATFVKGCQVRCRKCGKFIRRVIEATKVIQAAAVRGPVHISAVLSEVLRNVGVRA